VIAHQGGTERQPQNTLAAFNDAISLHLDFIETDVRHSADGVAVLVHGPSLSSACRPYGGTPVGALNGAQLARVRCAGQPIPRLTNLVDRLERPDAQHIGIMANVADTDPLGIRDILAPLGWQRAMIESFNWPALGTIEQTSPQVPTCPLGVTVDGLAAALAVTRQCIGADPSTVTADLIARAHAAHVGVLVGTVDDVAFMRRLNDEGADGLITDRPRRVLVLLRTSPRLR